ncbi:hypothetical protein FRB96_004901 [Tulasnella sp. 330]|nr:hypothetical protein FRB96_004901 [Tulasnella sp. 330]KAG8885409.1 hypothetical protein FRB97_001132 [Tulasnella sp. 331]KAG8890042.1 hypothetical protein FRB98_001155 [Tulasnella sp. 332]
MSSAAKPLKVSSLTNGKSSSSAPTPPTARAAPNTSTAAKSDLPNPEDISSPHELTMFVDTLLTQLEAKFDEMSTQVLDKMTAMSTRVDALEVAIQDLINDTHVTPLPTPGPSSLSRSESNGTVKSVEQTD